MRFNYLCSSAGVFLGLAFYSAGVQAEIITGSVTGVSSGDTFTLLEGPLKKHVVRLAEVAAPDLKQDFGHNAQQWLTAAILSRNVIVDVVSSERRSNKVTILIGRVYLPQPKISNQAVPCKNGDCGKIYVNAGLIKAGCGWVTKVVDAPDLAMISLENEARKSKVGLWGTINPEPPWVYRKEHKIAGSYSSPEEGPQKRSAPGPIRLY